MTTQRKLVVASGLLPGVMLFVVPAVSGSLNPLSGFVEVLLVYWLMYCVPVAFWFGRSGSRVSLNLTFERWWLPMIALALPAIVFAASGAFGALSSGGWIIALAIVCGLINGTLEELAWRRPFRAHSQGRLGYELIGLGHFTLWHLPLFFSKGMAFEYGALGLIGSSFLMGAIWLWLTRVSNSVGWPILSHALVNASGFVPLFVMNTTA